MTVLTNALILHEIFIVALICLSCAVLILLGRYFTKKEIERENKRWNEEIMPMIKIWEENFKNKI